MTVTIAKVTFLFALLSACIRQDPAPESNFEIRPKFSAEENAPKDKAFKLFATLDRGYGDIEGFLPTLEEYATSDEAIYRYSSAFIIANHVVKHPQHAHYLEVFARILKSDAPAAKKLDALDAFAKSFHRSKSFQKDVLDYWRRLQTGTDPAKGLNFNFLKDPILDALTAMDEFNPAVFAIIKDALTHGHHEKSAISSYVQTEAQPDIKAAKAVRSFYGRMSAAERSESIQLLRRRLATPSSKDSPLLGEFIQRALRQQLDPKAHLSLKAP